MFIVTTYLITGSNRGIGLELVRQLKDRGDDVIATCRSASPELNSGQDALQVAIMSSPLAFNWRTNSKPIPLLDPVIK